MQTIGDRVKALRKNAGLNQESLGDAIGVSHSQISAMENGRSQPQELLAALAKHFNVKLEWLINGEGIAPKGVVIPIARKEVGDPWKDALVMELKTENEWLKKIVENLTGSKAANFLNALSVAGGRVVPLKKATTGAQLGARA